jgi:hypothetical protein
MENIQLVAFTFATFVLLCLVLAPGATADKSDREEFPGQRRGGGTHLVKGTDGPDPNSRRDDFPARRRGGGTHYRGGGRDREPGSPKLVNPFDESLLSPYEDTDE